MREPFKIMIFFGQILFFLLEFEEYNLQQKLSIQNSFRIQGGGYAKPDKQTYGKTENLESSIELYESPASDTALWIRKVKKYTATLTSTKDII